MRLQTGNCYLLWSEQIVKLQERLDQSRWMALIWDHAAYQLSVSVYAIEEQLIDNIVSDPQSLEQRHTG